MSLAAQAVLLIVPHPSAVLPGIRSLFFLDLQSNLMSYYRTSIDVVPRDLPDPAGPLLLELSPSNIAEANAAVNGVQQPRKIQN